MNDEPRRREPAWVPSREFIDIYSVRRKRLAKLGIDVSGLDDALEAAREISSVGVLIEPEAFARFLAPNGSELGRVRFPAKGSSEPG